MNKHRDKFKNIGERLLNDRCLLPVPESEADRISSIKELNIAVLDCDLRIIKNNPDILNQRIIKRLDKYFDKMCLLLGYNSEIFKKFIRKLFEENN